MSIDTKEIYVEWDYGNALLKKPKLQDACDLILKLCIELDAQRLETERQKNRQDIKEQQYETMLIEMQNIMRKYF